MSTTKTDVRVTEYRAEFRGIAPFSDRKGWHMGRMEGWTTWPRRRAWTVAHDALAEDGMRDVTDDIRARYAGLTIDARGPWFAMVVPDTAGSRYGSMFLIQELPRNA